MFPLYPRIVTNRKGPPSYVYLFVNLEKIDKSPTNSNLPIIWEPVPEFFFPEKSLVFLPNLLFCPVFPQYISVNINDCWPWLNLQVVLIFP